jgi:hypothetical protein
MAKRTSEPALLAFFLKRIVDRFYVHLSTKVIVLL